MSADSSAEPDVDLWYAWTGALSDAALWERYLAMLPQDETDGVNRFAREPDRRRGLMARVLARTALAHYTGVEPAALRFIRDRLGKPELVDPAESGLSFNLSHTGGLVLCGVSTRGDVGVDAERLDRTLDFLPLARRFFAAAEVAALEAVPPVGRPRAFFELWTLKEALVKAGGRGLSMPLGDFAITFGGAQAPAVRFTAPGYGDPARWRFAQLELAGTYQAAAALCSAGRGPLTIRLRETVPLVREATPRALPPIDEARWRV
jgi:4'-phosphopantetheinyl transferase